MRRLLVTLAMTCVLLGTIAGSASARPAFRPRIRGALGLVPVAGGPDIAVGSNLPVVYHGGPVMRDVTIHTIFWSPGGFPFAGPASPGTLGYEALVERFFTDVAHDSGDTTNVFSVLSEYGDGAGPGQYKISYASPVDTIDDSDSYPPASRQCGSPQGVETCLTDLELQQEIDHVIQSTSPTARGLYNLWFIFLPPNVDTCLAPGSCGSNAYGGYHSTLDLGHGLTVYAVIPDPLIETTLPPGADPLGNPDAESAIGAAAHESVEAITDPEGVGWMDPNGNEVADKCEFGPELGTPIGYAPDGSPYNQLIGGDEWLIQDMWSNASAGCVQSSTTSTPAPALAQVRLTQFSPSVSGTIGTARANVSVVVRLVRAHRAVAVARARTRPSGAWGPVSLKSLTRTHVEAFGDDRDEIDVEYGAGGPRNDRILTGDGGNPFLESGWTGWFDLDHGFAVASGGGGGLVLIAPCAQTGVLRLTLGRAATEPPIDVCGTETDISQVSTGTISPGAALSFRSEDNRASSPGNSAGALVSLTVPVGEANSVSNVENNDVLFVPTGFPTCTADLRAQAVSCAGLVPGSRYALTRIRGRATRHATADGAGLIRGVSLGLSGGDVVTLRNAADRTLSTLHVAHLRVHIDGVQTVIADGNCEAGDYYGAAPTAPPNNAAIGPPGRSGSGRICPPDGTARGLSTAHIEQTDDLSGGETTTDVPQLEFTSPADGETLYGSFVALAGAGIPTTHHAMIPSGGGVALTITPAAGGPAVFRAVNVNTSQGAGVPALATGTYLARWVVTDANGDTRTVLTRFVEQG